MNSTTLGEHVRESRLIRLELGTIVALLLLTALVWFPKYQVNQDLEQGLIQREDVPEHVDRYRRTLAQIFGGIAILAGLYFTHRRLLATERNVEIARENQEATERQVEIAREGQITERFTRAIEQLGDEDEDRLAVRLGGIYALERIAWDSEKDHWTVMEVLTAFVRESTPVEEAQPEKGTEARIEKVAPDVQAALTVIGRRNTGYDPEGRILDLSQARIPRANFEGADLTGADLTGADLTGADLTGADLSGAILLNVDLTGATYKHEQLAEAEYVGRAEELSDEELDELQGLRQGADEDDQQPREEGSSQ